MAAGSGVTCPWARRLRLDWFGNYKTFDEDGIGFTFKYPEEFVVAENVSTDQQVGSPPVARKVLGLDEQNLIVVSVYQLNRPVSADDPAVKADIDQGVGQLVGGPVDGRPIEAGGLRGYEYEIAPPQQGAARVVHRSVVLVDGTLEYELNCQSTAERRAQVEAACDLMLDSLERK